MLRKALGVLRFLLGAAAGGALWWYGTPLYTRLMAFAARVFLIVDNRFNGVQLSPHGGEIDVSGPALPLLHVRVDTLTINVVLLCGLFATLRPAWRFLAALAVLGVTHVLATAADIFTVYAIRLGVWSSDHFTPLEQDLWTAVSYIYWLAGMYAIAFVCWYVALEAQKRQRRPTE